MSEQPPKTSYIPENQREEKTESSNSKQEDKKSTFEIGGVSLEVTKEYFEYPEYLQKESGILGYDRTVISSENLSQFLKDYYQKEYGIDISAYGFTDIESLPELNKKIDERYEENQRVLGTDKFGAFDRRKKEWVEYLESEDRQRDAILARLDSKMCHELLYSLSNGEYPNKSFTHEMAADVNYRGEKREEIRKTFLSDKMFLQKIYDLDYIRMQGLKNQTIFDSTGGFGSGPKSDVTVFDKKTNQKVSEGWGIPFAELAEDKYYNGIKNGEYYAATPNSGFNVAAGEFFFQHKIKLTADMPSFGFPMKEDSFFNNYLHKALDIYTKDITNFKVEDPDSMYEDGVQAVVNELVLNNEEIRNFLYQDLKGKQELSSIDDYSELFVEKVMEVVSEIEKAHSVNLADFGIDKAGLAKRIAYANWGSKYELRLPVFIGRDDIPQLRWGHAKYGHFSSSKGFNFVEFKHADKLPNKEE